MNELYAVPFWNVSTPSFVSADIHYFGTMEDISAFAMACRKSESHEEFLRGYDELQSGNKEAIINIAYCDMPIAEQVTLLGSSEELVSDLQWEMLNTWRCPYIFKADEMRRELIWIKHGDRFVRAGRYTVKALMFGDEGSFHTIANRWGNDEVIAFEEGSDLDCHSLFYFPERYFENEEECRADIAAPQLDHSKDLAAFCFEFIGDG